MKSNLTPLEYYLKIRLQFTPKERELLDKTFRHERVDVKDYNRTVKLWGLVEKGYVEYKKSIIIN